MKRNIELAGFETMEIETLEIGTDEPHPHIHMGDGACTLCDCGGFTDSGDGVTCGTTIPNNPGGVCGHTRGLHLDPA